MEEIFWKKCSNCKQNIAYSTPYQRCSVTTCNHERTGLQFCSVSCWSAHVPIYRHRDSWAIEETSPSKAQAQINEKNLNEALPIQTHPNPSAPMVKKTFISQPMSETPQNVSAMSSNVNTDDVLVVVSKLKNYIRERSEMNTSADVVEALSDHLRRVCDEAIQHARGDGRKTVMARDFIFRR